MTKVKTLEGDLAEIARLQAIVKRLSRTYQRADKEEVAAGLGVPVEAVDLKFSQWRRIHDAYHSQDPNARTHCHFILKEFARG